MGTVVYHNNQGNKYIFYIRFTAVHNIIFMILIISNRIRTNKYHIYKILGHLHQLLSVTYNWNELT